MYGAIRWLCQFSPLALRKVFKRESFKHTSHIDFTQSHPKRAREKKVPIGRLEEDRHCGGQGGDGIISAGASPGQWKSNFFYLAFSTHYAQRLTCWL